MMEFKAEVSISEGNRKMGGIKSVSLPRGVTCAEDVPCRKLCYVKHMDWRDVVRNAYDRNLQIYREDPDGFELQVLVAARGSFFFRRHVSGDIVDRAYLDMMCRIAEKCPKTSFLCFTKKYKLVNDAIDSGLVIPENLHILFSNWRGYPMPNPHNMPAAYVRFKDGHCDAPANARECGGRCEDCGFAGDGCWTMKHGDAMVLNEH